ncbi:cysteine methyltransferase [Limosilactobacillus oris]|nr:cysteine methyltransferase [Limosilactobacillus oris]
MVITMDEQFIQAVLDTVDLIPYGRVATYGQIARIICRPHNARLVGKTLGKYGGRGKHPCHRVVTANGRLAPGWLDQRPMLLVEGVPFKDECHVDISHCHWQGI